MRKYRCTPTLQKSFYRKGSALLAVVLVLAVISSVMSVSTAKISQAAINSTGSNKTTLQAQQYAASEAELIRSMPYSNLSSSVKTKITGTVFSKEVILGEESSYSSSIKQRPVTVNIYSDAESLPRSTVKLQRYSVEAADLDIGKAEYLGSGELSGVAKEAGFIIAGGSTKASYGIDIDGVTLGYVVGRSYGTGTISACVPVPKGAKWHIYGACSWAYWSKLKA